MRMVCSGSILFVCPVVKRNFVLAMGGENGCGAAKRAYNNVDKHLKIYYFKGCLIKGK